MLYSLEGIGKAVRDKRNFGDSVRILLKLARKVWTGHFVQGGLLIGLVGLVIAVLTQLGPAEIARTANVASLF